MASERTSVVATASLFCVCVATAWRRPCWGWPGLGRAVATASFFIITSIIIIIWECFEPPPPQILMLARGHCLEAYCRWHACRMQADVSDGCTLHTNCFMACSGATV